MNMGDNVEFTTEGGLKRSGMFESELDGVIYVIPDGSTTRIPVQSIDRVIITRHVGEKPFVRTEPHHFVLSDYLKRTKTPCGIAEEQMPAIHKMLVEMAIEKGEVVPADVLADYPDLVEAT